MGTPFISASHTFLHFPSNINSYPPLRGTTFPLSSCSRFSLFYILSFSYFFCLPSFPWSSLGLPCHFSLFLSNPAVPFLSLPSIIYYKDKARPFPSLLTPLLVLLLSLFSSRYSSLCLPFPFPLSLSVSFPVAFPILSDVFLCLPFPFFTNKFYLFMNDKWGLGLFT